MNNIYVEGEFLNHCNDCPFYNIETEVEFVGYEKNYHKCLVGGEIITGKCPLKLLSTRLAEERKKVVQEIREKTDSFKYTPMYDEYGGIIGTFNRLDYRKLNAVLDQIERGE